MDKRKKIAYSFFEYNKDKYDKLINNQLILSGENKKILFPSRFVSEFEFLFGVKDTLTYLIEWIINERNINIPENSVISCHNLDSLRAKGISWTEIVNDGIKKRVERTEWVYMDGKLVEMDDNKVSQ